MKKTLLTLIAILLCVPVFAQSEMGFNGGKIPSKGVEIGGIGADGKFHFFATDNSGNVSIVSSSGASAGATLVASTAYETSHVIKASAGTLISLTGYNSKASAQFIQLFNSATVPADAAVPVVTFTVPATSNFSYEVPITGIPFTTGIAVSNSSTGPTKTIGSADCFFTVVIK